MSYRRLICSGSSYLAKKQGAAVQMQQFNLPLHPFPRACGQFFPSPRVPSLQSGRLFSSTPEDGDDSSQRPEGGRGRGYGARERFNRSIRGSFPEASKETEKEEQQEPIFEERAAEEEGEANMDKEMDDFLTEHNLKSLKNTRQYKKFLKFAAEEPVLTKALLESNSGKVSQMPPTPVKDMKIEDALPAELITPSRRELWDEMKGRTDENFKNFIRGITAENPDLDYSKLDNSDFVDKFFKTLATSSDEDGYHPDEPDIDFDFDEESQIQIGASIDRTKNLSDLIVDGVTFYFGPDSVAKTIKEQEAEEWKRHKQGMEQLFSVIRKRNAGKKERRRARREEQKKLLQQQLATATAIDHSAQGSSAVAMAGPTAAPRNRRNIMHREGENGVYFADIMASFPKEHPAYPVICDLVRVLGNNPTFPYHMKRTAVYRIIRKFRLLDAKPKWAELINDVFVDYAKQFEKRKIRFDPFASLRPVVKEQEKEEEFW